MTTEKHTKPSEAQAKEARRIFRLGALDASAPLESLDYLRAQFLTQHGLEEAIQMLNARRKLTGDPAERSRIDDELGLLQQELQQVADERTAFMAGNLAIRAPAPELVTEIKELADRLDATLVASTVGDTIIETANKILELWDKTRS